MHKPGKGHHSKIHSLMRGSGYKVGGRMPGAKNIKKEVDTEIHKHESHMHPGETPTKLKDGGTASEKKSNHRMDKLSRGGHPKKHSKVNVNIIHPPMAAPPPPMPDPTIPMGGPGMPPPGIGGMKRGGRTKLASGGKVNVNVISPRANPTPVPVPKPVPIPVSAGPQAAPIAPSPVSPSMGPGIMPNREVPPPQSAMPQMAMKNGGRLKMTAGAGSGEGRLEKADA